MDNYIPIISFYWSNRAQYEKPDRKITNGTQTGCSVTFKEKEEKEVVIVSLKNLLVTICGKNPFFGHKYLFVCL